jgi:hypothetical protein
MSRNSPKLNVEQAWQHPPRSTSQPTPPLAQEGECRRAERGLSLIQKALNKVKIRKNEEVARAGSLTKHQRTRLDAQTSSKHLRHLTCRGQGLCPTDGNNYGMHEVLFCPSHAIIPFDNARGRLHRHGKGFRGSHRRRNQRRRISSRGGGDRLTEVRPTLTTRSPLPVFHGGP